MSVPPPTSPSQLAPVSLTLWGCGIILAWWTLVLSALGLAVGGAWWLLRLAWGG